MSWSVEKPYAGPISSLSIAVASFCVRYCAAPPATRGQFQNETAALLSHYDSDFAAAATLVSSLVATFTGGRDAAAGFAVAADDDGCIDDDHDDDLRCCSRCCCCCCCC